MFIKILLIVVLLALVGILIWQRRRVAAFLQGAISPRWNNRILIGLWILSLLLLLNAIYQGGGEPMSLRALREVARPGSESPIVRYYSEADRYFTGAEYPQPPAPPLTHHRTWFWWHLWLFSLILATLYIPFAFWDEITGAWHRAQEAHEQRRRRFNLRPPQPPQPPQVGELGEQPQAPPPRGGWQRFRERFFAAFSADVIWEFAENAFRSIILRRRP